MAVLFWIFLDQICPKWIKLDQTCSNWISHQSKNVSIKSCHIYKKDKNGCFILDQIGSDLSKTDQTWPNWISHQSTHSFIWLNQIISNQIRSNQKIRSSWIKLVQIGSKKIKIDQVDYFVQIRYNWFK
jgi:hypothetical protein